jgi:catechol 2,3-dioxygenase-like lactoylglutathione lyase family enzyme
MAIQRIHFQSIPVADQDRALTFYTEKLGFEVYTDAPDGEGWRWIFLTRPGAETRLHFASTSDMEVHDKPALCLVTNDVDDECKRLGAAGVNITNGADDAPWAPVFRWAMIRDTEDNLILLESFKEE